MILVLRLYFLKVRKAENTLRKDCRKWNTDKTEEKQLIKAIIQKSSIQKLCLDKIGS